MKAVSVHADPKPYRLSWEETDDPPCGPEEVIVDVAATAVNRADLLQARGLYPAPAGDSPILGLEIAGRVSRAGEAVSGWQPGDRVFALAPGGGYAQKARIHHRMLMPMPEHWDFASAAAIPEAWLTAASNLFMEAGLSRGDTVLIHAGASGVGTAAIQLACAAGATVAATAGSAEKCDQCRRLGADIAVNYRERDFADAVTGVDVVLDCVGGPYLERNLAILKPGGRLVCIGLLGGGRAEIDLAALLGKSLRIIGTRMRARPTEEKIAITDHFKDRFLPLLENGSLRPVIDRVFPITEAGNAHEYVTANRSIGKVVLAVTDDAQR